MQAGTATSILVLCAFLFVPRPLHAQSSLPATALTDVGTAQPVPATVSPQSVPKVQWNGHLLQIATDGQPLSAVLREVAMRANIHITGSTPDDRIFGTYGPAPLVDVLASLVDGMQVNMLFVEHTGSTPSDLTFTARNGSATPPANTSQYPQSEAPQAAQQPQRRFNPPPQDASPQATTTYAGGNGPANGTQQDPTGSNPASPNGVKTPQEIFEQLQRLRANAGASR